jgi:hypothetical protein
MSVSSKADAEGGKWSVWVAAVVAQRDSEVVLGLGFGIWLLVKGVNGL